MDGDAERISFYLDIYSWRESIILREGKKVIRAPLYSAADVKLLLLLCILLYVVVVIIIIIQTAAQQV